MSQLWDFVLIKGPSVMLRKHSYVRLLAIALLCSLAMSSTGCCARRGYLLHGDWSLELNRVPWRDDHCADGGHDGCSAIGGPGEYAAGGAVDVGGPPPRSRFHPVPTHDVFAPTEAEPIPAPAAGPNPAVLPDGSHGSTSAASQGMPARYARKAKTPPCSGGGVCQTAATQEYVEQEPTPAVQSNSLPAVQPSPIKPKARLSTAWRAATR